MEFLNKNYDEPTKKDGLKVEPIATEIIQPETLDMKTYQEDLKAQLKMDDKVLAIANEVKSDNPNSIVEFGKEASEGISKVSDQILNSFRGVNNEEAGALLIQLTKIMDKFEIKDFKEEKEEGFFGKIFNKAKNSVEKLMSKYDSMGKEIDGVYRILKTYEDEIKESNKKLEALFAVNMKYYEELEKYIVAGEYLKDRLDNEAISTLRRKVEEDPSNASMQLELQKVELCREMLDQRIQDLRIAENVALQSLPMIRTTEYANFNLVRKINSAFIITLPIFKQALAQTILLKKQELQAKSLKALDEKTNELLLRNANNTVIQNKLALQMAGQSSIKVETLQRTFETIMGGIEETKRIEEENRQKRQEDKKALEELNNKLLNNL